MPPDPCPKTGVLEVPAARGLPDPASTARSSPSREKCTHLGCRVPFCESSSQFECPCHGSVFNRAGELIDRARRPGASTAIRCGIGEDGLIYIDTGSPRTARRPGPNHRRAGHRPCLVERRALRCPTATPPTRTWNARPTGGWWWGVVLMVAMVAGLPAVPGRRARGPEEARDEPTAASLGRARASRSGSSTVPPATATTGEGGYGPGAQLRAVPAVGDRRPDRTARLGRGARHRR